MDRKLKKKNKLALKIVIILVFFFVFMGGIFYGLVFTPWFRIEKIFVEGAQDEFAVGVKEIANQKLGKMIFEKIPVNNLIFLPDEAIIGDIMGKLPEIKAVNLNTKLNDRSIKINLQMRQASAIWCRLLVPEEVLIVSSSTIQAVEPLIQQAVPDAENCFFVDDNGFVFKTAPNLSGGIIPIVYEQLERDLNIKDIVSNSKALKFILESKKQLDADNLNLTDFVISGQTLGDLEIISPDGWKIILNLNESPAAQINALKRVLDEEIKEKRNLLDYVDLRVENRVYYKFK